MDIQLGARGQASAEDNSVGELVAQRTAQLMDASASLDLSRLPVFQLDDDFLHRSTRQRPKSTRYQP